MVRKKDNEDPPWFDWALNRPQMIRFSPVVLTFRPGTARGADTFGPLWRSRRRRNEAARGENRSTAATGPIASILQFQVQVQVQVQVLLLNRFTQSSQSSLCVRRAQISSGETNSFNPIHPHEHRLSPKGEGKYNIIAAQHTRVVGM